MRPAPPPALRAAAPPVLRVIAPAPVLNVSLAPGLNMSGWTRITSGPINGSPALIQFPDGGPLAVVGVGG
ncbi:MAG: hypothetical protein MUF14_08445, partial [Hyphomonadaceae bacterium]|nr:hypothetical protein [Hyphomonadaceae bacterium]